MVAKSPDLCDSNTVLSLGLAFQASRFYCILMGKQAGQLRLRPVLDPVRQPACFTRLDWRLGYSQGVRL